MMPKTIVINKIPYCLLTHVGKSEEKNIIVQNEGYVGERLIGGWVGKGSQHTLTPSHVLHIWVMLPHPSDFSLSITFSQKAKSLHAILHFLFPNASDMSDYYIIFSLMDYHLLVSKDCLYLGHIARYVL